MIVYILYNAGSGGQSAGAAFKSLGMTDIGFADNIRVKIYDIVAGTSGNKPAFQAILADTLGKEEEEVRVLVAGGDGSVMWAFNEIFAHGIDPTKVAIGVLPFGTGNDFARVTGWGANFTGTLIGKNLSALKKIVDRYVAATIKPFDLWNVEVELHSDGTIKQVKKFKKVDIEVNTINPITGNRVMKKLCGNYFSIGVESRVGLGFDKKRTSSVTRNKLVYAREGIKKYLFKRTILNNILVDSCNVPFLDQGDHSMDLTEGQLLKSEILRNHFAHKKSGSLAFINIPSISAGCDLWKLSKADSQFGDQDFGDKKIELVSVTSLFEFARARAPILNGNVATKIGQYEGPYEIVFKSDLSPTTRSYMQIDGEYYQVNRPATAKVEWFASCRVLVAVSTDASCCCP